MSKLRVAPIVEGHGEVTAVRRLLERVWVELLNGEWIDVLQPIRQPRTKLLKKKPETSESEPDADEIRRVVMLACNKLSAKRRVAIRELVFVLLDADQDCPKNLGPSLRAAVESAGLSSPVAVVLANVEYETWFVAAAASLSDHIQLAPTDFDVENPEQSRFGKKWIEDRFKGARYSETVDQVKLTAKMDLGLCRKRSPSFDKLCRELELVAQRSGQ